MTGTQTRRWGAHRATGRTAAFSAVNIFRIGDAKVVDIWNHRDDLGLLEQLGVGVFAGAAPR